MAPSSLHMPSPLGLWSLPCDKGEPLSFKVSFHEVGIYTYVTKTKQKKKPLGFIYTFEHKSFLVKHIFV